MQYDKHRLNIRMNSIVSKDLLLFWVVVLTIWIVLDSPLGSNGENQHIRIVDHCEDGWHRLNTGKCLLITNRTGTLREAIDICSRSYGAHLLKIESTRETESVIHWLEKTREEHRFEKNTTTTTTTTTTTRRPHHHLWGHYGVVEENTFETYDPLFYLKTMIDPKFDMAWISLIRLNNTDFVWIDSLDQDRDNSRDTGSTTSNFTNWAPNEPNQCDANKYCTIMDRKSLGQWYDWSCSDQLLIICQRNVTTFVNDQLQPDNGNESAMVNANHPFADLINQNKQTKMMSMNSKVPMKQNQTNQQEAASLVLASPSDFGLSSRLLDKPETRAEDEDPSHRQSQLDRKLDSFSALLSFNLYLMLFILVLIVLFSLSLLYRRFAPRSYPSLSRSPLMTTTDNHASQDESSPTSTGYSPLGHWTRQFRSSITSKLKFSRNSGNPSSVYYFNPSNRYNPNHSQSVIEQVNCLATGANQPDLSSVDSGGAASSSAAAADTTIASATCVNIGQ